MSDLYVNENQDVFQDLLLGMIMATRSGNLYWKGNRERGYRTEHDRWFQKAIFHPRLGSCYRLIIVDNEDELHVIEDDSEDVLNFGNVVEQLYEAIQKQPGKGRYDHFINS